ncbi:MAG TPA: hypothetical protein DCG89_05140, partial [Spartobacteria bacterium]|nr:hypothetical protein [Spartobacteria bacterium]
RLRKPPFFCRIFQTSFRSGDFETTGRQKYHVFGKNRWTMRAYRATIAAVVNTITQSITFLSAANRRIVRRRALGAV